MSPLPNDQVERACDDHPRMSIGNQRFEFKQDERAVWPRGIDHRLWTEDTTMETLMVERYES